MRVYLPLSIRYNAAQHALRMRTRFDFSQSSAFESLKRDRCTLQTLWVLAACTWRDVCVCMHVYVCSFACLFVCLCMCVELHAYTHTNHLFWVTRCVCDWVWDSNWQHSSKLKRSTYSKCMRRHLQTSNKWTGLEIKNRERKKIIFVKVYE